MIIEKRRNFLNFQKELANGKTEEIVTIFNGSLEWNKEEITGKSFYARIKVGKRTVGLAWIKPKDVKESWK